MIEMSAMVIEDGDVTLCLLGSRYRSGRSPDWLKLKNPAAPAVKREAEETGARTDGDDADPQARRPIASSRRRLRHARRRQGRWAHLPSGRGCAGGPPVDVGERPRRADQTRGARLCGDVRGGDGGVAAPDSRGAGIEIARYPHQSLPR